MSKPIAVLISDVHYNVHTLPLADAAMRKAIQTANFNGIPLIVAGDLHDTKANLRGECVNAMIETFKRCERPPYILVGNHCRINEKAPAHSLNFLAPYAVIVDAPMDMPGAGAHGIPYYSDPEELKAYLKTLPRGSTLVMHQGLVSSNAGEYIQDKSAITTEDIKDFRVISGHYHTRQTIGNWDYIGNPYTLNFAEANDPSKGFQILYDDGRLGFVDTELRKHVASTGKIQGGKWAYTPFIFNSGDLLKVKLEGTKEELMSITKELVAKHLGLTEPFKLEVLPVDTTTSKNVPKNLSQGETLDNLIDSMTNTSDERKTRLKELWRNSCQN